MRDYTDVLIHSLPLSCLPSNTRELLSCLLDTPKVIPNDEPDKLPRDWRGLAFLLNVPSEVAAYIQMRNNKTAEVLEIWQRDNTATVGQLLKFLERLDRYDVHDDLCNDLTEKLRSGQLVVNRQNQIAIHNNNNNNTNNNYTNNNLKKPFKAITYDDKEGYEHQYDAFVLYAKEDKQFVDELLQRMTAEGFQLCTEDRLQAGHMTKYAPVAQLISERCQRIILVCSPEFLSSQANTFYRDYAQAVSIESTHHKIIPIMYRDCQLPSHLAFYHKLYYNEDEERAMYDFWDKLKQSLELVRNPRQAVANRINGTSASIAVPPQINIVEMPPSSILHKYLDDDLFLPSAPRSISMNDLDSLNVAAFRGDCNSLSSVSQKSGSSDEKKKKPNKLTRIWNTLKLKKSKKALMVAH